jgi:excinuclease ABC subunit C
MYNKERLKELPHNPGVYMMKNIKDEIIYVGKAKNLKNRVKQYFQSKEKLTLKTAVLVSYIHSIEIIITDSEMEALILESNLIKKHRPRYNILLKDDKSYPWICVTINEAYPRIMMTREYKKDGAKYFGPFTSGFAVKNTIDAILKVFKIRTCTRHVLAGKVTGRPCLNYHIGQCLAPCQGNVSQENYQNDINEILDILNGRQNQIINLLKDKMTIAVKEYHYEEAGKLRDQIIGINHIVEKQKIILNSNQDQDFIGLAKENNLSCIHVFHVRDGKLMGRDHFFIEDAQENEDWEILESFIKQYYETCGFIPKEIFLKPMLQDHDIIIKWLSQIAGKKINLVNPKRGQKVKMLEMVRENADLSLKQRIIENQLKEEKKKNKLDLLRELLNLENSPTRIEAYDVSNISGTNNVGGMVVYSQGKLNRKACRRFKINSVDGQNDYASMQEMVFRRMERGMKKGDDNSFLPFPDLIMVDGGIGHVNAVNSILSLYSPAIEVCGLIKDEHHRLRGVIYKGEEYYIKKGTPLGVFLFEVSEEVHRFTIGYHRILRKKTALASNLEKIPGVGKKRRELLMKHFGGIDKIKTAKKSEIMQMSGFNDKIAESIVEFFKNDP